MRLGCALLALAAACGGATPRDRVAEYRQAIGRRDAQALWRLHDDVLRAAASPAELERMLREDPAAADALFAGLAGPVVVERAEIALASGRRVSLVRAQDGWRIEEGGLEVGAAAGPLSALAAFFQAVESGRLDRVRERMPDTEQGRYADDRALSAHLAAVGPRIAAAKAGLAPLADRTVVVDGDRAEVPWGEGRAAVLVREQGRWKVQDLE